MTIRESDDRIVPLTTEDQPVESKSGNVDAGKAVRISRDRDWALPVHRDGPSVLTRLDRISQRAKAFPEAEFNNLFSLLTNELLLDASGRLKKGKAPGLEELLRIRISDPELLHLIQRFLNAGVMIDGQLEATEEGVPQGASLSPLLANVYLHYVLDQWFERDVKPRLRGESHLIRFADDFICCFELESDARRYQTVLPKRLGRYSLEVAEDKTKLIRFGRFARRDCQRQGGGAPETFDFLGFTHYCGLSRGGKFKLKRKTSGKKLRVKLCEMRLWFHHQLSTPVGEMWQVLNAKLRGHYQYYGINDNWPLLMAFRSKVRGMAKRHLSRRSQKSYVNGNDFNRFTDVHPLAGPKGLTDLIALNRRLLNERAK